MGKGKILVTGSGFVGKALIKSLLNRDYTVRSLSTSYHPDLEEKGIEQFQSNILDYEAILLAFTGIDYVIHTAARVGLWGKYQDFHNTNVTGTQNIIRACKEQGVKYLIFTSSASVVFNNKDIEFGNEELPYCTKNHSNYAYTKALAEQLIRQASSSELRTISLRPHLIWGPGDKHIIPGIVSIAREGKLFQIGRNNKYVDTVFIDNLIHAILLAMDSIKTNRNVSGNVYFITNGEPVKTWDFVNSILKVFGIDPIKKRVPKILAIIGAYGMKKLHKWFFPGKEPRFTPFLIRELSTSHWFDIKKAKDELSYTPIISIEEGLNKLREN